MSKKPELFDADPEARKSLWFHDQGDDGFVIETRLDAQPIIDYNEFQRNASSDWGPNRWDANQMFHHVARVPINVVEKELMYRAPDGSWKMRDEKYMMKWFDRQDRQLWRTKPGRLS